MVREDVINSLARHLMNGFSHPDRPIRHFSALNLSLLLPSLSLPLTMSILSDIVCFSLPSKVP